MRGIFTKYLGFMLTQLILSILLGLPFGSQSAAISRTGQIFPPPPSSGYKFTITETYITFVDSTYPCPSLITQHGPPIKTTAGPRAVTSLVEELPQKASSAAPGEASAVAPAMMTSSEYRRQSRSPRGSPNPPSANETPVANSELPAASSRSSSVYNQAPGSRDSPLSQKSAEGPFSTLGSPGPQAMPTRTDGLIPIGAFWPGLGREESDSTTSATDVKRGPSDSEAPQSTSTPWLANGNDPAVTSSLPGIQPLPSDFELPVRGSSSSPGAAMSTPTGMETRGSPSASSNKGASSQGFSGLPGIVPIPTGKASSAPASPDSTKASPRGPVSNGGYYGVIMPQASEPIASVHSVPSQLETGTRAASTESPQASSNNPELSSSLPGIVSLPVGTEGNFPLATAPSASRATETAAPTMSDTESAHLAPVQSGPLPGIVMPPMETPIYGASTAGPEAPTDSAAPASPPPNTLEQTTAKAPPTSFSTPVGPAIADQSPLASESAANVASTLINSGIAAETGSEASVPAESSSVIPDSSSWTLPEPTLLVSNHSRSASDAMAQPTSGITYPQATPANGANGDYLHSVSRPLHFPMGNSFYRPVDGSVHPAAAQEGNPHSVPEMEAPPAQYGPANAPAQPVPVNSSPVNSQAGSMPVINNNPGQTSGNNSPASYGLANSGPVNNGPANSGPANNGPVNSGPTDNALTNNGPVSSHPMNYNPVSNNQGNNNPIDTPTSHNAAGNNGAGQYANGNNDIGNKVPIHTVSAMYFPLEIAPVDYAPINNAPGGKPGNPAPAGSNMGGDSLPGMAGPVNGIAGSHNNNGYAPAIPAAVQSTPTAPVVAAVPTSNVQGSGANAIYGPVIMPAAPGATTPMPSAVVAAPSGGVPVLEYGANGAIPSMQMVAPVLPPPAMGTPMAAQQECPPPVTKTVYLAHPSYYGSIIAKNKMSINKRGLKEALERRKLSPDEVVCKYLGLPNGEMCTTVTSTMTRVHWYIPTYCPGIPTPDF